MKKIFLHIHCRIQSMFGDTGYSFYCKLRLVPPPSRPTPPPPSMMGADNPRLLEKALSGKELHQKLLKSTKTSKTASQEC